MGRNDNIQLRISTERQHSLSLGNAVPIPINDYEQLDNLPQINGNTLIGNKLLSELIGDTLILDGGTAEEVTA